MFNRSTIENNGAFTLLDRSVRLHLNPLELKRFKLLIQAVSNPYLNKKDGKSTDEEIVIAGYTYKRVREGWIDFLNSMYRKCCGEYIDDSDPKSLNSGDCESFAKHPVLLLELYTDVTNSFGRMVESYVFLEGCNVYNVDDNGGEEKIITLPNCDGLVMYFCLRLLACLTLYLLCVYRYC